MGKAAGYFLILAGVSSGAYALMPDNTLAELGSSVRSSVMATAPQAVMAVRTEAAAKPQAASAPAIVPPAPQLATRPNTNTQVAQAIVPAAPTVVLRAAETSDQQPKAVPAVRKAASAEDESRVQLARDIQRELKRVGCYSGDVNGEWTSGSRAAMNQFIERINATLPTDQPDHILKTLVQGHPGNACGKTCPAGQGLSNEGRCQPTAILAQQTAPRRVVTRSATASREGDEQPARPAVALAPKTKPAGWETKVVTAASPAALAPAATQAAPAAVALVPRGDTPEGRMAVGAPASAIEADGVVMPSVVNPLATGSLPAAKPSDTARGCGPAAKGRTRW